MSSGAVAVMGADGLLGAAVAKALVRDFKVKAVALGYGSMASDLASYGIEVITANPDDPNSLLAPLQGCFGCFVSTCTLYQHDDCQQREASHGANIAEACSRARVEHIVVSAQMNVRRITGLACRHMDSKAEVEASIRATRIPTTSIVVPTLYQEFLMPPLRPKRCDCYTFAVELPMGNTPMDLINADDVGGVVVQIFHQGSAFINKTLNVCGDKLSTYDICKRLSESLSPRIFTDKQITVHQFGEQSFKGAADYATMFDFFVRKYTPASIDSTHRLNQNLISFEMWARQNSEAIAQKIDYATEQPTDAWAKR